MLRGRVLVTGADGFIGSHLTEFLVREGCAVRAFVQYTSQGSRGWLDHAAPEVLDNCEVVAGDIRDAQSVRGAVAGCATVLHLAALIAIPYSYQAPESYIDTNVKGTLNVLQAVRDLGVERLVQTSTSEVYGTARAVPIGEDHPLQAQSPYAASKIAADQLALSFHRSFGTPVAVLRPFNTYGPRQSARAVIPTVITQIAAGRRRIALGHLHPTRDFTLVGDTARGFAAIAGCDAAIGEVVNIGSGFEISIGDLVRLTGELMGVEVEAATETGRTRPAASEVERLWADTARARALFGWQPAHGGIDGFRRGLAQTIAWFRDPANLRLYRPGSYAV